MGKEISIEKYNDIDDIFAESEGLKCLLPRYASVKRFQTPYGRSYGVYGAEYKMPHLNWGLTTWLGMSNDGVKDDAISKFTEKYGVFAPLILQQKADLGTLGHYLSGELFTRGYIDTGANFKSYIQNFMLENGLPLSTKDKVIDTMAMYMYSLSCFAHEKNFECWAVEYAVTDFQKHITTCIDFVGQMDDSNGERINVTINLKVRDTPYCNEKDIAQTNIEMFLLNNLLEKGYTKLPKIAKEQKMHRCYILSPKKITSRTRENYCLYDTTDKYTREQYEHAQKTRELSPEKPLEMNIDAMIPEYKNTRIVIGEKPRYYTLRQKLGDLFLD